MDKTGKKKHNELCETKAALCRAYANKAREALHGHWDRKSAQEWEAEAAAILAKKEI